MDDNELSGKVREVLKTLATTSAGKRGKMLMEWYEQEKAKEANIEVLELACALWTCEILPQYTFKPIPIKPPIVIKHEKIPIEERQQLTDSYYEYHPGINSYYGLLRTVKVENQSNYSWLQRCIKILRNAKRDMEADVIAKHIENVGKEILLL